MSSNTASPKLEMLASRCFEHVAGSDCSLELVANPSGSNYCPRLTAPKHPQNYVGFEVVVSLPPEHVRRGSGRPALAPVC